MANDMRKLMMLYDRTRSAWVQRFGSAEGFDAWFSAELKKRGRS